MNVGDRYGNEIIIRCPSCGDSSNPHHGHLAVNLSSCLVHCFRCGFSQRLSVLEAYEIATKFGEGLENAARFIDRNVPPPLYPGAGTTRYSKLARYHYRRQNEIQDAFRIRDAAGLSCGVYLRGPGISRIYGASGFEWPGEQTLKSSPTDPLILVEGPYDVLTERHICAYGFLSARKIRQLKGHFIILCPDGDIWSRRDLLFQFKKSLQYRYSSVTLMGVTILKQNLDPDEVTNSEQLINVQYSDVAKLAKQIR